MVFSGTCAVRRIMIKMRSVLVQRGVVLSKKAHSRESPLATSLEPNKKKNLSYSLACIAEILFCYYLSNGLSLG